uniref:Uncharacterized protein n=1 Tax=Arundo donax TaxID=35708 RepID=A0A0A9B847_ARUDO
MFSVFSTYCNDPRLIQLITCTRSTNQHFQHCSIPSCCSSSFL